MTEVPAGIETAATLLPTGIKPLAQLLLSNQLPEAPPAQTTEATWVMLAVMPEGAVMV